MKKILVLAAVGCLLLAAVLIVPRASASHDVDECFTEHVRCRENALNMDDTWFKVTLALTFCDIMLAKCILTI